MNIGIVTSWDSETQSGELVSAGCQYFFAYADGRTIIGTDDTVKPLFGTHEQPEGFKLKIPRAGDILVFQSGDSFMQWAYAEHYVSAALRKVPSEFRTVKL